MDRQETRFERVDIVFQQLKRYLSTIVLFSKSLYTHRPFQMVKVLLLSFAGTTLQGVSLGTTLFVLKHVNPHLHIKLTKIHPLLHGDVHVAVALAGIFSLFGVSIFLIYLAQKQAIELSLAFAAHCGEKMAWRFPIIACRLGKTFINPETGIPSAYNSAIKSRSLRLDMIGQRFLRSSIGFFQLLYGVGFLLYLEPLLTVLIFFISIPLLFPLRHFILAVREAERLRCQALAAGSESTRAFVAESDKLLVVSPTDSRNQVRPIFDDAGLIDTGKYRAERRIAEAGTRAVAVTAMIVTGMTSILYFGFLHKGIASQLALIVVYFGALRMTVMSARQIISLFAGFARFYEQVLEYIEDESTDAVSKAAPPVVPQNPGIYGPDLAGENGKKIMAKGNGPFAVAGFFPLTSINRYAVVGPLRGMSKQQRLAVVSKMAIITEDFSCDRSITWREFLGFDVDARDLGSRLKACCHVLNYQLILQNIDKPVYETQQKSHWSPQETIEALFLRAYFLLSPLIVAKESVLLQFGDENIKHWLDILSDQLVFIYYQYDQQREIGGWAEHYLALVGYNPKEALGVVTVEWANQNPERVMEVFENAAMNATGGQYGGWGDDEEDEE